MFKQSDCCLTCLDVWSCVDARCPDRFSLLERDTRLGETRACIGASLARLGNLHPTCISKIHLLLFTANHSTIHESKMASALPAKLNVPAIAPFARRAAQLEKYKPIASYWCKTCCFNLQAMRLQLSRQLLCGQPDPGKGTAYRRR